MLQTAETEKTYLIPIPIEDLDPKWTQTQPIPVTYKALKRGSSTFVHLTFSPEPPSALTILAGDNGNVEMAAFRIRAQMLHRLEHALATLQTPNPHPTAALQVKEFGQYFSSAENI